VRPAAAAAARRGLALDQLDAHASPAGGRGREVRRVDGNPHYPSYDPHYPSYDPHLLLSAHARMVSLPRRVIASPPSPSTRSACSACQQARVRSPAFPAWLVRSTAARRSGTLWSPRRGGWSGRNNRYRTHKRRLFNLWLTA
jgi:hypothetical protein